MKQYKSLPTLGATWAREEGAFGNMRATCTIKGLEHVSPKGEAEDCLT